LYFLFIEHALLGLTPLQLGSFRIVLSALFIFIFGYHSLKNLSKTQWKWLGISGFLGSFFPSFLFAYAETEVDSGIASILNSLVPLNTIIFGIILFKINSSRLQIFGVLLGFVGAVLLIFEGSELNLNQNYWYALEDFHRRHFGTTIFLFLWGVSSFCLCLERQWPKCCSIT